MSAKAYKLLGLCGALFVAALAPYVQSGGFELLNYDDPIYLDPPSRVSEGLNPSSLRWALTTFHFNWHPLTWVSHMLDFSLFGGDPGAMHLHSAVLHALNAVLLFVLLTRFTGRVWHALVASAVFALHPLRAEAVLWISARKDLLSSFFWLMTILAYGEYVRRREERTRAWPFYVAAMVALVAGLMSKGMLVSLPVVLLLLDAWPFRRFDLLALLMLDRAAVRTFARLVVEKTPMFLVAAGGVAVTVAGQAAVGAIVEVERISLPWRVANAVLSYTVYLGQLVWPANLSIFYPHPAALGRPVPWTIVAAAGGLLVALTVAAFAIGRRRPYVLVGWFWYLISLFPVIGLVQIGRHAHADRYTYLPLIGVVVALTWLAGEVAMRWRVPRVAVAGVTGMLLALLLTATVAQASRWRDSKTTFSHAVEATPDSFVAHNQLGLALVERGDLVAASPHFDQALRLDPTYATAHNNFANALVKMGDEGRAAYHYLQAIKLEPSYADAVRNWSNLMISRGTPANALPYLQSAVQISPRNADLRYDFGVALAAAGGVDAAVEQFLVALQLRPRDAEASLALAQALALRGDAADAAAAFSTALELAPDSLAALKGLAWLLATHRDPNFRDGPKAISLAEKAVRLSRNRDPQALDTLAAAYAEAGRFDDAIRTAEQALKSAAATGTAGEQQQHRELEARLAAYRSGRSVAMMRAGSLTTGTRPATTRAISTPTAVPATTPR